MTHVFTALVPGKHPWGIWMFGSALLVLGILSLVARFGWKLGAQQIFQLDRVFEAVFGESVRLR